MKSKKRTLILVIIALIAVVGILVGTTYAYFTASVTNATAVNENVITTGTMALEFTDGPEVKLENAAPGSQVEKTFKVKNIGTVATKYDVYFSELINTFADKTDLVYTLESSDGGYSTTSEVQVPSAPSKIVDQQSIGVNETHTYKLTVTFKETNDNQNDNAEKTFSSKIDINKYANAITYASLDIGSNINMLWKSLSNNENVLSWYYNDTNITSIQRSNTLNNTDNIISTNNSMFPVYTWYDNGTIYLYSDATNISLNKDCSNMFMYLTKLNNLDLSIFDVSNVTNMQYMLAYTTELSNIKFGDNFDTSSVTTMYEMFNNNKSIEELNLSNWNIASLQNAGYMFENSNIKKIDISNWNFSNYTYTSSPFQYIFAENRAPMLETLIAKNIKLTSSDLSYSFKSMPKIKSIDLSNIDMGSNVTNMEKMFAQNSELLEINGLENFVTTNVENMYYMFNGCSKLTTLDLSSFETYNVTNMNSMFYNSKLLTTIYVDPSKWSIASVNAPYGTAMFQNDTSLVGGAGTTYDSSHYNEEYARVDDPDNGKPGYFTLKS